MTSSVSQLGSAFQPSLLIVGTGIEGASHATLAAQRAIEQASKVLFAVADPWTVAWLRGMRPDAESLSYGDAGAPRSRIYRAMVDQIMGELRTGHRVCAVFYGNPALLTRPAHAALQAARAEGFVARILPGVSSLDCLFADLGFDPGEEGCQMYEATDFLTRPRAIDVHTPLLLWQVALVGNPNRFDLASSETRQLALAALCQRLLALYPGEHPVVLYQASPDCTRPHQALRVRLGDLATATLEEAVTLFLPKLHVASRDPEILERLRGHHG